MSLAVVTAAVLAVVLVVGLLVVLGFLFEIRRLVGEAADAMEQADAGTARLAAHLSGLEGATSAAAGELPTRRA
jgi:hypothetical protein